MDGCYVGDDPVQAVDGLIFVVLALWFWAVAWCGGLEPQKAERNHMRKNEFSLRNITGGSGGTYRLNDGRLPQSAIRTLTDAPHGGWEFWGPAARAAADRWRWIEDYAHDLGLSPLEVRQ